MLQICLLEVIIKIRLCQKKNQNVREGESTVSILNKIKI